MRPLWAGLGARPAWPGTKGEVDHGPQSIYDSVRRFSGESTCRQILLSLMTTPSSTTRALCSYSLTLPVRLLPGYRWRIWRAPPGTISRAGYRKLRATLKLSFSTSPAPWMNQFTMLRRSPAKTHYRLPELPELSQAQYYRDPGMTHRVNSQPSAALPIADSCPLLSGGTPR